MTANTKIEWADHTFNPWTGCTKVSPGCDHCYAEGWSKRSGHVQWGPQGERRRTSASNWATPLKWNEQARLEQRRFRVFCASLADVFDNHRSIADSWRADLWSLIDRTQHLDWLLLTKRPQNIGALLPSDWGDGWPNVWLGTTVENQVEADRRIPHLLAVPAQVRFLSCEPLLGRLNLRGPETGTAGVDALTGWRGGMYGEWGPRLHWVICGGESGPGARPMHPDWARSLRDQCQDAGVAFHFKQWGDWKPTDDMDEQVSVPPQRRDWLDSDFGEAMIRVGKKAAGRLLDGRTWDEMPS